MAPQTAAPAPAATVRLSAAPGALFPSLPAHLAPDRRLMHYYFIASLALGPAFIFMLVPRYFRFRSMRYEIDEEGISMKWGVLYRREISLTYSRIQDIHLTSNFVERWLGLGRIQIQTASASADAEMTIEGLPYPEAMRDFLYARMRGARDRHRGQAGAVAVGEKENSDDAELTGVLKEIAAEVRALREALPTRAEASDAG